MSILPRATGHGGQTRGLTQASQGMGTGRFGQMFGDPGLDRPTLDDAVLVDLADLMTKSGEKNPDGTDKIDDGKPIRDRVINGEQVKASDAGDENPAIPAGYTYFGQFVDHDITFDPTPLNGIRQDPGAMTDFRTPALDLDSVYGSGPDNQPYLYDFSTGFARLRTGDDLGSAGLGAVVNNHDHLRLGPDGDGNRAAVLGDKRNDENKIVAQVHTTFVALHNKLIGDRHLLERMCGTNLGDAQDRFRTAVRAARWHYQWVVLFDYVDRLCEPDVLAEVLNAGGVPRIGNYAAQDPEYAYMPVEFSVAAYRMGHSMVRPTYALNAQIGSVAPFLDEKRVPIFKQNAGPTEAMNGFGQAIPGLWGLDWSFFLPNLPRPAPIAGETRPVLPQPSYRIDASLVDPLRNLPEFQDEAVRKKANLAYRNLKRSQMDGLPSGEAVASALGITPLTSDDLWGAGSFHFRGAELSDDRVALDNARKAFRATHATIHGRTPLWYYILREAELFGTTRSPHDPFGGQHLGPVGSRIVAETFVGLLWYDRGSFLHSQTGFRPVIPAGGDGVFRLSDLVKYALS